MRREEIAQINEGLLERFINSYIKSIKEKDFLYLLNDGLKSFIVKDFISKSEHGELVIKEEALLGWCFITAASEVIRKFFNSLEDWNIVYNSLYDNKTFNRNDKTEKMKIAVVLAVQAITGTTSPDVIQRPYSWYWTRGHSVSKCNVPIYFDLGQIVHSVPFRNGSCTKTGQYIVYPIIKDLFYDLIYRASNLLEQNFDVTYDKRRIRNILYDLQIVPQYVVFYYMDRIEIYRCDPEIEE